MSASNEVVYGRNPPKERVVPLAALALLVVAGSSMLGTSSTELSSVSTVVVGDGGFAALCCLLVPSVSTVGFGFVAELLVRPASPSFCFDRIPQPNKSPRFLRTFDLLDSVGGAAAADVMAAVMMCDGSTVSSSAMRAATWSTFPVPVRRKK